MDERRMVVGAFNVANGMEIFSIEGGERLKLFIIWNLSIFVCLKLTMNTENRGKCIA